MSIVSNAIETARLPLPDELREILIGTKPLPIPEGAEEVSLKFWGRDIRKDKFRG